VVEALRTSSKSVKKRRKRVLKRAASKNELDFGLTNNKSQTDFNSVGKGLIILGSILLLTYFLFFAFSTNTPQENISEDEYRGPNIILCAVPISILLIGLGALFFILTRPLVKLSEFVEEVESGRFEEKVLKELEKENGNYGEYN
jgi:hypothetical protein